ncbi:ATP-binding protein [Kitasatospora sp. NA04385]|uniref:ATP-binding protein n=1 Tax=Kitasatospora sp. NA04385 TaxID=2742135 RepID=UPI0026DFD8E7|nr:ATP-binding protein [Kitasatospora sp. NA04385]
MSGVKCFEGVREVDVTIPPGPGWTVFAGPNGSGKTALLRVLAMALGALPPGPAAHWGTGGWVRADPAPRWRVGDPPGPPAPATRCAPRAAASRWTRSWRPRCCRPAGGSPTRGGRPWPAPAWNSRWTNSATAPPG